MVKIVDNYSLTSLIGQGQYGKVYFATNLQTKIQVAIKAIPLSKFSQISKLVQLTKNQLQILKSVQDNINIIKFVEMMKTDRHVYLVYQYCQGGTLEDFIKQKRQVKLAQQKKIKSDHSPNKGLMRRHSTGLGSNIPTGLIMPQKQALGIFKQILNAFRSLYNNNILHRDVKPNNIFFKSGHLKLADFGFCKRLKNSDDLTQTSLGSPMYMAPQVLSGDVYGSKADIWSVGIVLYQLLFGICPFSQNSIKQLLQACNGSLTSSQNSLTHAIVHIPPDMLTPTCQGMLMRMLQKDQFKRISWQDFFYQYEITQYGTINRKEKDFQYDLMKLMKRTSGNINNGQRFGKMNAGSQKNLHLVKKQSFGGNGSSDSLVRFDWAKITDLNSSIHSQELDYIPNHLPSSSINNQFNNKNEINFKNNTFSHSQQSHIHHTIGQAQLDQIYMIKKKTKQFEQQHLKMVELSIIIQNLISSQKKHQYSHQICFVLVYNLERILLTTLTEIQNFIIYNKQLLDANPNENNTVNKIYVVFNNQKHNVIGKLQSIRINILNKIKQSQQQSSDQDDFDIDINKQESQKNKVKIPDIIKYSDNNVKPMRKAVRQYVKQFVKAVPNVLSLSLDNIHTKDQTLIEQEKQLRQQTLFLLNIIWGCLALPKPIKQRNLPILNIKKNTRRLQIAKMLNKILVGLKSDQLINKDEKKSKQRFQLFE